MLTPHRRLIGTWKSDRGLTLANCHRYHLLTGAKKRKFGSIFGSLVLRYTRRRLYIALGETKWSAEYDVLAEDSESIVLRIHSEDHWKRANAIVADILKEMAAEPRFQHIQFRTRNGHEYYWIGCGVFCEWFKRQRVQPGGCTRTPRLRPGSNRASSARHR